MKNVSFNCLSCKMGKSKTLSYPTPNEITISYLDLIHTDVWGITPTISHSDHEYFVKFIDDYNCFTWVYFLHAKFEVFDAFTKFLACIETQLSKCIKVLRSNLEGICFSLSSPNSCKTRVNFSKNSSLYSLRKWNR